MKNIIVYYERHSVIINKVVAERLGLKRGYNIKSEKEFWHILDQNISHMMALCNHELNKCDN